MNIQEIQSLTKRVQVKRSDAGRKAAETALKNARKRRKEMIENAKDVSFFIEEIEKCARDGKNKCSISLSGDAHDAETRLEMKYIKKKLVDFGPTFTRDIHETCSYNWEGGPIDGSERSYWTMTAHFNW